MRQRFMLYVAADEDRPDRFCVGSCECIELIRANPSLVQETRIENVDVIRHEGAQLPSWLYGTPTLVDTLHKRIMHGTSARDYLARLAVGSIVRVEATMASAASAATTATTATAATTAGMAGMATTAGAGAAGMVSLANVAFAAPAAPAPPVPPAATNDAPVACTGLPVRDKPFARDTVQSTRVSDDEIARHRTERDLLTAQLMRIHE